jgi:hypothetical protein
MAVQKMYTHTVGSQIYQEMKLFHDDRDDTATSALGGIQDPANTGYTLYTPPTSETSQDPIVHSYRGGPPGNPLRFIVGKIVTLPTELGKTSESCVYTELNASYARVGSQADIPLQYKGTSIPAGTDPHGFAQINKKLYIADYDSIKIPILGAEALAGATGANPLDVPYIDIGTWNKLPPLPSSDYQYHGNGIVALKSGNDWYLFVLIIASNNDPTPQNPPNPYAPSQLVRIKLASDLTTATEVVAISLGLTGLNAVDMDVHYVNGNPVLLISCIGGKQQGGSNNGTASTITMVSALFSSMVTTVLITGDELGDFRSIAIDNGKVYILVGYFNSQAYTGFKWQLYWIDAGDLVGLSETSLSQELEKATPLLHEIAVGDNDGGYFWALMARGGRLLFVKGSAMVFIDESNLSNTKTFPRGTGSGTIGDANINSIDDTEGTLQQSAYDQLAAEGKEVPEHERRHHHHHCHHHHHLAQIAVQAAQAAQAAAAQAEQSAGGTEGTGGTGK